MKGFFHSLGKGILYFFTPFVWAIGIALGSVVTLVVFLCYAIYFIFLFFSGRNLFKDLPEDEKAKAILAAQNAGEVPAVQPQPQAQTQVFMNNPQVNLYQAAPGYPYPNQQNPFPGQPGQPGQPTIQVTIQPQPQPVEMEQPAPIEMKDPIIEEEEPVIETPQEEEYEAEPEPEDDSDDGDFETLDTEEEIEEYGPQGGSVFDRDIKGDDE